MSVFLMCLLPTPCAPETEETTGQSDSTHCDDSAAQVMFAHRWSYSSFRGCSFLLFLKCIFKKAAIWVGNKKIM